MTEFGSAIGIQPVVSWPRNVLPGGSYLITVDLRLTDPSSPWPYDEEELAVGCMLDGRPACTVRALGDTGVILHRFGGTYGPARFLAEVSEDRTDFAGTALWLTLTTAGGVPFYTGRLPLDGSHLPDDARAAITAKIKPTHLAEAGTAPMLAEATSLRVVVSYAEDDAVIALEIVEWLRSQGIDVYNEDPRSGGFSEQIEDVISNSDAFLALLSPAFLSSPWCRREWVFASQHERNLRASEPDLAFVHVLQILATPGSDTRFLHGYDWVDLTSSENMAVRLGELASLLRQDREPGSARSHSAGASFETSPFRDRQDELDRVLHGLTTVDGPHFWLVIAPPKLGKTWFLQRVSTEAALSGPSGWVTNLVDVAQQSADVRRDPSALLARLFGLTSPVTVGPETLRGIARDVIRAGKPYLCLLDSAELLDRETAATLRLYLSQTYKLVRDARRSGVRLSFIVASRRDDEWRGITPAPRLSPLPLTEFKTEVVRQALTDLASEMGHIFSSAELRRSATLVHNVTEGLPALLVNCLQWIKAEEWYGMERLESQELFDELTNRYIQQALLTRDSLFPGGQGRPDEPLLALEQAYRVLAPHRLFTQSHLRHYLESDPVFSAALRAQQWHIEDLWRAISGTALLSRPFDEPWQQIHTAIRRLLYRYYYKSDEQRAKAHTEARKFIEVWADQQVGKEKVVGLVECLWHEAVALRILASTEMEYRLTESARALSLALTSSSAYALDELREYAAERMRYDEELEDAVGDVDGLFTRLIGIVVMPLT